MPEARAGAVNCCRLLAEALAVPCGLIVAGLITRRLGSDGYGLFSLATSLVSWVQWTLASLFARATIKLISEADDWRPLGGAVLRLMSLTGLGVGAALWLLAEPVAAGLGEPRLAGLLRLLALETPIFCAGQAHRQILIGLGHYSQRAWATAARWVGRVAVIVVLVEAGFGVTGAVVGSLGASVIELVVQRAFVQPPLRLRQPVNLGPYWAYSLPLFISAASLRFYDRLDLVALKALGGTVAQAGIYGAAQRIALVPSALLLSFSPLLLSTITHLLHAGNEQAARRIGRYALRALFGLAAVAAAIAGSGEEIVALAFGPGFEGAAPLLNILLFAVLSMLMISICTTVLTAHSRPRLVLALTAPLLPLALAGYLLLIPRLGPPGAALTTALITGIGALICLAAARRGGSLPVPVGTLLRCLAVGALVYFAARLWPAPGLWVLLKLAALTLAAAAGLAALGEFSAEEYALGWGYVQQRLGLLRGEPSEAQ